MPNNSMTKNEILERITDFGDQAHGEQMRKYAPDRYMVHPVRVMQKTREYTDDIAVLAAALLHDVLEDTQVGKQEINAFLHELLPTKSVAKAVAIIEDLTDVYIKENYQKLNRRERKAKELERLRNIQPDSQTVKYADILDNTLEIVEKDPAFARVYLREVKEVLKVLNQGNSHLRSLAMDAVNQGLNKVRG